MFRSFIYLDEDKLYTYKKQLEGSDSTQLKRLPRKNLSALTPVLAQSA